MLLIKFAEALLPVLLLSFTLQQSAPSFSKDPLPPISAPVGVHYCGFLPSVQTHCLLGRNKLLGFNLSNYNNFPSGSTLKHRDTHIVSLRPPHAKICLLFIDLHANVIQNMVVPQRVYIYSSIRKILLYFKNVQMLLLLIRMSSPSSLSS